ncbi:MAG: cytochrome c oxidase assembly factor Coa1 family protein [Candidatus Acidiferrales bacterium]
MSTPAYAFPGNTPTPPTKTWFARNWKWFVPVLVCTAALTFATLLLGIFLFVTSILRSTDPYRVAVQTAAKSPLVAIRIGSPFRVGWLINGNVNVTPEDGSADLSIPIRGSHGGGHIVVSAKKENGEWKYQTREVDVNGDGSVIHLLSRPGGEPGSGDDSV